MILTKLSDREIKTLSHQDKDSWWLKNIYQEGSPQLTLRSTVTGILLGCLLTLSNFYIGIKTGWTLGVGLTSVLLSYSAFKLFSQLKLGPEISILENNAMQSIATSAGYMTQPLIAGIPAFILVSGHFPSPIQVYIWIVLIGILGALIAFPLKRKYINDEQLPFPEGTAAAELMVSLHSSNENKKNNYLFFPALLSALVELLRNAWWRKFDFIFRLPERYDDFIYRFFTPTLLGTPLKDLTIKLDTSLVMIGSGILLSFPTAFSMFLGGVINYFLLAPLMIQKGIIQGTGFKNISTWSLWGGAALMTSASLYSFFSKASVLSSVKDFFKRSQVKIKIDPLKNIELPLKVSFIGVPILTLVLAFLGNQFFGLNYYVTFLSVCLVFFLSIMSAKATGLTSITPGGAMAKITQLIFSILSPGNPASSILSAGITTEICYSSSNLLMDIKPGYLLGAKPRQQAVGHIIGIFFGSIVSVSLFFAITQGDLSRFGTEELPFPAALVWKSLSEVLAHGLSALHESIRWMIFLGLLLGIFLEKLYQKNILKLSPIGMGLGFILPFSDILPIFIGSLLFYLLNLSRINFFSTVSKHRETIAAGLIAGGAITGMTLILLT